MSQDEYEKARAEAQCSMSHLYECAQGSLWKLLWAGDCNAGARCERLAAGLACCCVSLARGNNVKKLKLYIIKSLVQEMSQMRSVGEAQSGRPEGPEDL